jgi:peptide/nickel transport system permease protein
MPDDRELLDTGSSSKMLANRIPMTAATDEAVLDMQAEAVDEDGQPLKKKPFGFLFWFAVSFVGVVLLSAVLANVLPLQNPNFQNYTALNQAPSSAHLIGTDDLGRDLLARLVFGARVSLIVGFAGVIIGLIFGGTAGLVSGYRGGRLDVALNAFSFIILAFPAIVAVIAIVTFWGASLLHITIILGIATIPLMYRVIRASSLAFAQRDFVIAAKTMGATDTRIVLREILPNVVPVTVTFSLITMAGLIVIEGTLAFLGLSVALPTPSWGNLINEGSSNGLISINPYIMLWPALAMFLLLWSINLIGDRLRQRFDIREGLL